MNDFEELVGRLRKAQRRHFNRRHRSEATLRDCQRLEDEVRQRIEEEDRRVLDGGSVPSLFPWVVKEMLDRQRKWFKSGYCPRAMADAISAEQAVDKALDALNPKQMSLF